MRRTGLIILIVSIASTAQGPSTGIGASTGQLQRGLGAQIMVTDPHKLPNPNGEQIIGTDYQNIGSDYQNGSSFHVIGPRTPICANPDHNLVMILTWLTSEQGARLELATEKSKGICGDAAILDQIHKTITTYQRP